LQEDILSSALLEITDHSMPTRRTRCFGPVLVMQAFDTEAEAVRSRQQLRLRTGCVSLVDQHRRPLRIARKINAGTVWINDWAVVYSETEEGGYKQSGLGRLNGVAAMDDFIEYKTIVHEIDLNSSSGQCNWVNWRVTS